MGNRFFSVADRDALDNCLTTQKFDRLLFLSTVPLVRSVPPRTVKWKSTKVKLVW